MKHSYLVALLLAGMTRFIACEKEEGCTDPEATNYEASAEKDDGSCNYLEKGCTDPDALNYDSTAEINDGSCQYAQNTVTFHFTHYVDEQGIEPGKIQYRNAAGNDYSVERIKYYVSDITFHQLGGEDYQTSLVHYQNFKEPETKQLTIKNVPDGDYSHISLVFGIPPDTNKTGNLPNEPRHNQMEWPEPMGGGYHFMKFEGKFLDSAGETIPFNCHTGRLKKGGQIYNNAFTVKIPNSSFTMDEEVWEFQLAMSLNEWFTHPDTFNWEHFGPAIMNNLRAQEILKRNGQHVFSLDYKLNK